MAGKDGQPPATRSSRTSPARARTSLKDLAAYLDLSQTTISFVLNDAPLAKNLSEETRRRVLEAARKFNYRPSYFARNLNKTGSDSVGVIAPDHSEGYFTKVMASAERYFMEKKFLYFTACHYWQPELIEEYPRLLLNRGAEGLLLLNSNADFETPLPVVTISGHLEKPGVTNVVLDHLAAARLTLQHLHRLGHRRIAFLRGHPTVVDTPYRWDAMMQMAQELGVAPPTELTVDIDLPGWSPEIGYEALKRLVRVSRDFTALVAFNDISAIGAIRALHDAGIRVPQDVSVVGFDDIVSAEFSVPSLTTVRQPLTEMGTLGASILLERIADPERTYEPSIFVKPQLMVRESTAAAPA
jgi:LacI family transcriptional regulator